MHMCRGWGSCIHPGGRLRGSVAVELGLVHLSVWALAGLVVVVEAAVLPFELLHKAILTAPPLHLDRVRVRD